jgi:hypothetical protein
MGLFLSVSGADRIATLDFRPPLLRAIIFLQLYLYLFFRINITLRIVSIIFF